MEAHIESETAYSLSTPKHGPNRHVLTHVLLPDECLSAAGIDIARFKDAAQRVPSSAYQSLPIPVSVQMRYNATGKCSGWRESPAAYVPSGALHILLIPHVPGHAKLFATLNRNDQGGLFMSLPIQYDSKNRFDPFTSVAIRFNVQDRETGEYEAYMDLLFSQEELVPPGTRYDIDANRLKTLFRQFIRYTKRYEVELPSAVIELGAKLEACLSAVELPGQFDIMRQVTDSPNVFDTPTLDTRLETDNIEIANLIKKAAEAITRRAPVSAKRPAENIHASVVSGLRQGAIACLENNLCTPSSSVSQKAVIDGLEPVGKGRFARNHDTRRGLEGRNKDQQSTGTALNLEDILMFDEPSQNSLSPKDLLSSAVGILADGLTIANRWRCGGISIVPRTHSMTKKTLYLISYERSIALGGRSSDSATIPSSLSNLLATACMEEGVDHPSRLPQRRKTEIATEAPILAAPLLKAEENQLRAFSPGSETELMINFKSYVSACVIRAVGEALKTGPNLYQLISYDVYARDVQCVAEIASRTPHSVRAVLQAIASSSPEKFSVGALRSASISFLARHVKRTGGKTYYIHTTGNNAEVLGGDYQPVATRTPNLFLFDYYSAGGECMMLNKRPIPVILRDAAHLSPGGPGDESIRTCAFPEWFVSRATCERFLPGESYAYICVGYDERMRVAIVLPAGFMLAAHAGAEFNWPLARADAVLSRLCSSNTTLSFP
ncbi:UL17 protein [Gallid alphaherpesvirus 3]|uniref:UL17 protein n=2 Tax=Gallid alphaherpesvirus 3 TaxID=35250 RepID=Q782S9_9ALPH|nr:DNA packaging tegument protein UL17 [Gallid alphaherpesvirus 3]YP_010795610.1 UL17-like protein [Gallid alphaherpesvirus 3]BAA82911.1 UL17 product homolog [Marek's disease virus serotype 2 MDV2]AEI00219.1 UL17-like protein [Gallid alphaherpesvirus 3]QEY02229.1 UL17-like protein [Gallid alphaherpesvirus 3]BAB16525.1 UL17 protein [Gallid alphaherpesvirus 3]